VSGAEFAIIPGSGHMTQNDNLDAVLSAIRGFLSRVEAK
jgi:pimeloyl-ACP methyl ester carboxylesterase